jgi:class 3 adenylate cyclase
VSVYGDGVVGLGRLARLSSVVRVHPDRHTTGRALPILLTFSQMQGLATTSTGCLLVADITGYTAYLQATELAHAEDVLSDLLETMVSTLAATFTLSKLEGDAAFAHAPAGRVSPSLILDTVEAGYFAFRRRLRDIDRATSCDCNACVLIPSLDLKYVVHHGEYVARRIAGTEELTGADVILVHRLLKTEAGTALGTRGFAAYTASTLDTFGMDPDVLGFSAYQEETPDMGPAECSSRTW